METVGVIPIKDVQGTKFDGEIKYVLKSLIPGTTLKRPTNVSCGELLLKHIYSETTHYNYMLSRDSNVLLSCDINDVALLNREEFLLLEAIKNPSDRLTAFKTKLEWGCWFEKWCSCILHCTRR